MRNPCLPHVAFFEPMLARSLLFLSTLSLSAAVEIPFKTVGAIGADYPTVQAAIDAVPAGNPSRKIILIQPGAFFGHTVLDKPFVALRGSGPGTLLTFNLGQEIPGGDMRPLGWRGAAAFFSNCEIYCRESGYNFQRPRSR
jgi:hypothetical protein